ncbi:ankyrin repeat domain-containing protein [Streptomyces actinomycinicus]|uniref:Ankyrin repeat domain-containing protein n=1 Tax=Streptomyces actinomycinicus TaxID=1695166 RepID=A0A937JPD4_9ACTN|nr:ankyrin repeat domain-containing protein [Streptomyces actinomycinicus]MBL1082348.1 ankyrin repeat domain-containing protein [Streptomyces actinomycinicus]
MSARGELRCFPPDEAASRRRVRRYAVPGWMIERATERRLAGDWRGACAAANVDVAFDLAEVAGHCGDDVATALENDLRHFAPDLLRWHLPRMLGGRTTLATDTTVVLARYRPKSTDERPRTTPYLHVTTPAMSDGPQRLTLRFRTVEEERAAGVFGRSTHDWRSARHLWDVRHATELRERCGGGTDRPPFFHADATPRGTDALPTADPGHGDPAARAEWATLLHQDGDTAAAFAAAGLELDLAAPQTSGYYRTDPEALLGGIALNHTRLEPEIRRLAAEGAGDRFLVAVHWRTYFLLEPAHSGGLRVRVVDRDDAKDVPFLAEALWRRLPDLDLMRIGGVAAQHLHPLVRQSLFPALQTAEGPAGPPGPTAPAPVRVRCRGDWHEVSFRPGGLLRMPHSDEEQQRERAMRAFGGAVAGCFAVEQTWTSGEGRLPKALRAQRNELFQRAQHGDTPGVLELLDAGVDPRVRDGNGRTLLHVLNLLDHETLLPRLLAEGLDLEARDRRERTPLFVAVNDLGSKALVEALVAAGARLDTVDQFEMSLAQLVRRYKRPDLAFLRQRVEEEHPGIGAEWWDERIAEQEQYDEDPDDEEELPS